MTWLGYTKTVQLTLSLSQLKHDLNLKIIAYFFARKLMLSSRWAFKKYCCLH